MLDRITLPRTNLEVSRLSLGTANYGVYNSEYEVFKLLDHYVSKGGNFIDTARVYSDWIPGEIGRCERILGDWLRANSSIRSNLVIATKGLHYDWSDKSVNRVTYEAARFDIEKSLDTLGVDSIDLYYLHRDSPFLSIEEIIDFLQVFIEEGKIKHLAVANWKGDRLAAANEYAKREGKHGFVANQPLFSLGSWNIKPPKDPSLTHLVKSEYDYHREHNLTLVPYSSQSQGFFTKVTEEIEYDSEKLEKSRFYTKPNLRVAKLVKKLATGKGCNANGIGMAYLLQQPFPIIPVVGCNNCEKLEDSIKATKVKLELDEIQSLEDAINSGIRHS